MEARWAIFGLLDAKTEAVIRRVQSELSILVRNDRALRFPVHVTVKGRFLASESDAESVFRELAMAWNEPLAARLCAPSVSSAGIAWLSVSDPDSLATLRLFHRDAEGLVAALGLVDEVPFEHKLNGYVPHATLAWNCRTEELDRVDNEYGQLIESLRASVVDLALVRYPVDWFSVGRVEVCRRSRTAKSRQGPILGQHAGSLGLAPRVCDP
jgi:2'-5' RNA ligase